MVKDEVHVNFVAEDELAISMVNLKVYFWATTHDFRRGTLQTRGRLIKKVKTKLEENGFNLPANITGLNFMMLRSLSHLNQNRTKVNNSPKKIYV